jgi:hypothetical protein
MLTGPQSGEGKANHVTGHVMSPRENRVRWHLIPTRSGNGTYWYALAGNLWTYTRYVLIELGSPPLSTPT